MNSGEIAIVVIWAVSLAWVAITFRGAHRAYQVWRAAYVDSQRWLKNKAWGAGALREVYVVEAVGAADDLWKIMVALYAELFVGVVLVMGLVLVPQTPSSSTVWYSVVIRLLLSIGLVVGAHMMSETATAMHKRRHEQRERLREALPNAPQEPATSV